MLHQAQLSSFCIQFDLKKKLQNFISVYPYRNMDFSLKYNDWVESHSKHVANTSKMFHYHCDRMVGSLFGCCKAIALLFLVIPISNPIEYSDFFYSNSRKEEIWTFSSIQPTISGQNDGCRTAFASLIRWTRWSCVLWSNKYSIHDANERGFHYHRWSWSYEYHKFHFARTHQTNQQRSCWWHVVVSAGICVQNTCEHCTITTSIRCVCVCASTAHTLSHRFHISCVFVCCLIVFFLKWNSQTIEFK